MSNAAPSLLDKLSTLLNRLEGPPAEAPAPEPEVDPTPSSAVGQRLGQFTEVLDVLAQLTNRLKERMALLQIACHDARLLPPRNVPLHPRLALQRPAIADLLRQDPTAARLTAPAVLRYYEAHDDVARMQELLAAGRVDGLNLEAMRGKYLFLSKIQLYFKDHPLLVALFRPKAAAAAPAPDPLEAPPAPSPPPALPMPGYRPGGTGSLGQRQVQAGTDRLTLGGTPAVRPIGAARTDQLNLANSRPAPAAPQARPVPGVVAIARPLLEKLELRMLILRAAVDPLATVQRKSAALLPPPAQETARALAAALELAPEYRERAREALRQYQEARGLLERKGDQARLRTLCGELTVLPRRLAGHPLLEKLFAA